MQLREMEGVVSYGKTLSWVNFEEKEEKEEEEEEAALEGPPYLRLSLLNIE